MVQDRKEPTFSPTSNKSSQSSDVDARSTPRQRLDTRPQVMIQKQPSSLLWIALLIALLASAASAYIFWQFTLSQKTVAEQQVRLLELEKKLLLSDDESTQSLTALTANVKGLDKNVSVAMSEVDKLWATRNANLKKLAAAKTELNNLIKKTDKRIDTSSSQSKKTIDKIDEQLKKTLVTIKQNRQKSSEQELLIQSLRERSAEQNKTINSIRSSLEKNTANASKVANLEKELEQLLQQLNTLSRRTKEYDEAIESFDKFRLTTNRDLITLKNRAGIAPQ